MAPTYRRAALAQDTLDLIDALGLAIVVMGGWSVGGIAARIFTALHPERVSHTILIATVPPGEQRHQPTPLFFELARKSVNTLEDEYFLFFDGQSGKSRAAAQVSHQRIAARTAERSPPIPEGIFLRLVAEGKGAKALFEDDGAYAGALANASIPILAVCGDHDIVDRASPTQKTPGMLVSIK